MQLYIVASVETKLSTLCSQLEVKGINHMYAVRQVYSRNTQSVLTPAQPLLASDT